MLHSRPKITLLKEPDIPQHLLCMGHRWTLVYLQYIGAQPSWHLLKSHIDKMPRLNLSTFVQSAQIYIFHILQILSHFLHVFGSS